MVVFILLFEVKAEETKVTTALRDNNKVLDEVVVAGGGQAEAQYMAAVA